MSLTRNLNSTSSRWILSCTLKTVIVISFSISVNNNLYTSIPLLWLGSLVCLYIFHVLPGSFYDQITNILCPLSVTKAEEVRKGRHGINSKKEKIRRTKGLLWRRCFRCGCHSPGQVPLQSMLPAVHFSGSLTMGTFSQNFSPNIMQMGNPTEGSRAHSNAQRTVIAFAYMFLPSSSTPPLQEGVQDSS